MNTERLTILSLVLVTIMASSVLAVQPFGANYTIVKPSERAPMDEAANHTALAGNVTQINVFGYSPTQTWQGYYGNVSGTVQLADASDNVMYNWSLASPEGEIYATTIVTVDWAGIECFDMVDNESLETAFNIAHDDVDGVDETFATGNAHDMFYTNNIQFTEGECPSTSIYDSDDSAPTQDDNHFEEVMLTDDGASTTAVIFAAILDEEDVAGFDGALHDFEMLVLEDGHGTDIDTTTYYFYVELE